MQSMIRDLTLKCGKSNVLSSVPSELSYVICVSVHPRAMETTSNSPPVVVLAGDGGKKKMVLRWMFAKDVVKCTL